jgi:hypothetical protein
MKTIKNFSVYILIKDKKPIYIGCSSNVENRVSKHKLIKNFDEFIILKTYKTKKEALIAENSLIRFISVFGGKEWLNSKDAMLCLTGDLKGFNNCFYVREEVEND